MTPKLWPSALCLSRSPGLFNRSPGVHSAWCWLSLLHLLLQVYSPVLLCSIRWPFITFKLPRGDMDTPSRLRNFFQYRAIGMCHFRYLWNGLCDRHRAVQRSLSSGASVYESIIGFFFTLSHFISQFPPTRIPLITAIKMCHFVPVHHLEWHFWPSQKV